MGLDVEIKMRVFNKETNKLVLTQDIAYWRKCYGVRNIILDIARKQEYWRPFPDELEKDYSTHFTVDGLKEMCSELSSMLKFPYEFPWNHAVWYPVSVISITLENLKTMIATHIFLESGMEDAEALNILLGEDGYGSDKYNQMQEIAKDVDNYFVLFELINSY